MFEVKIATVVKSAIIFVTFLLRVHVIAALPVGWLRSSSADLSALPGGIVGGGSPFVLPFKIPSVQDEMRVLVPRELESSPCSELDLDDLQSLPGWPKLANYAIATWGSGDFDIEINPSGYDDRPATMCVADPVLIHSLGKPKCKQGRVDIPPQSGGTEVIVASGYANVGNWNITRVTTAGRALLFEGTFRTPNLTTPPSGTYTNTQLHSLDAKGEFINAPFNSFGTLATNMTHETKTLTKIQDRSCIATVSQQICTIPAGGRIQMLATGYVWFTFKTKRAPVANPWGPKHRRYAVKLEELFSDVLERSAWIEFSGFMNSTLRTDYFEECRWNFQL